MATQLLKILASLEGCAVECGSFKGGSAANFSLVCALCRRQLEIFDSFEGVPAPSDADKQHVVVNEHEVHAYSKGSLRGTLAEVRENSKNGAINACNFGYFEQTLSKFQKECVRIFLDVDLVESLKTCFKYLWPLLQDGCYLFTYEAHHTEVAALFFEDGWRRSNMKCKAPGLIGAGTDLRLLPSPDGFRSALGCTIMNPTIAAFEVSPQTGVLS